MSFQFVLKLVEPEKKQKPSAESFHAEFFEGDPARHECTTPEKNL